VAIAQSRGRSDIAEYLLENVGSFFLVFVVLLIMVGRVA
jgi:hypothetical protein